VFADADPQCSEVMPQALDGFIQGDRMGASADRSRDRGEVSAEKKNERECE
jgi:hypothetical protein